MTRTRAADDFVAIRARMEELRRGSRPRAADDFAMIRARMEELRRERARVLAETGGRSVIGPRPYHRAASSEPEREGHRLLPRVIRGRLLGWGLDRAQRPEAGSVSGNVAS